jgi:hypothetical protein
MSSKNLFHLSGRGVGSTADRDATRVRASANPSKRDETQYADS